MILSKDYITIEIHYIHHTHPPFTFAVLEACGIFKSIKQLQRHINCLKMGIVYLTQPNINIRLKHGCCCWLLATTRKKRN